TILIAGQYQCGQIPDHDIGMDMVKTVRSIVDAIKESKKGKPFLACAQRAAMGFQNQPIPVAADIIDMPLKRLEQLNFVDVTFVVVLMIGREMLFNKFTVNHLYHLV